MQTKDIIFSLIFSLYCFSGFAQHHIPTNYPKDYFRNPLNIPILLAGNFAECRPNHFHGGLDIKTEGKENLPVHAAAEGYIVRAKIEKGGYGHAIYIKHPNGFTTVYAHLNNFMPQLQKRIESEQYEKENWKVDLSFSPTDFPVKKGDIIAYSGNTGASTAPHLHFEIRDTSDHSLNPQLFGFEINDKIAPKPTRMVVYNLHKPIYEQSPQIFDLVKSGDVYHPAPDTIIAGSEQTGIGLVMNDYMDGSDNTLTYYTTDMQISDAPVITIRNNYIGHHDTRYLNAYADYKLRFLTGDWVQCLFQIDGNKLEHIYEYPSEYCRITQRGKLEMGAGQVKLVRIEIRDANGNMSTIRFYIKNANTEPFTPTYCENTFYFGKRNNFSNEKIALIMEPNSLYEHICLHYDAKPNSDYYSDRFELHYPYVPVHKEFNLYINTSKPVPESLKNKIVLMYSDGKDESGQAAEANDDWYKASVRKFGNYWLVADTTAPTIKPLQKENTDLAKAAAISFEVNETTTSVASFRAELDGKWLAFEQSGKIFTYKFDSHCKKGKHKLVLTAADENGNKQSFSYNFTR